MFCGVGTRILPETRLPDQRFAAMRPNGLRVLEPAFHPTVLRRDRDGATDGLHPFTENPFDVASNFLPICIFRDG